MAQMKDDHDLSKAVAADYSLKQFYLMALNASDQWVLATVLGQKVVGTLLNKPDTAGDYGKVRTLGFSKVVLGGSVTEGADLCTDASAKAITKTNDTYASIGTAMEDGSSGETISYLQVPGSAAQTIAPAVAEPFDYGADLGYYPLQVDGTAVDGTAGVMNVLGFGSGNKLGYFPIVGQTINPAMAATGLDIQCDQTALDGLELYGGVLGLTGRPFIVGTDAAFYFSVSFSIADVSGTDEFHIGFRRAETPNATYDDYLDLADLAIITNADPAAIYTSTILAGAATAETDTTDTLANTIATVWRVNVSAAGVCTFLIDGAAPTAVGAYTFSDGCPVIPFLHILQHADFTEAVVLTNWEVGYQ